jgi:hypothetical protein
LDELAYWFFSGEPIAGGVGDSILISDHRAGSHHRPLEYAMAGSAAWMSPRTPGRISNRLICQDCSCPRWTVRPV